MIKKNRFLVMLLMMSMLTMLLTACGGDGSSGKEAREADEYVTVEEGGVSFQMPDYFGDPEMTGSTRNYYAETGSGTTLLQMFSSDGKISDDSFDEDCEELHESFITGIRESEEIQDLSEGGSEAVDLDCGLKSMRYDYTLRIADVDCDSVLYIINNPDAGKVVFINLTQSSGSEYDYHDAFDEMVTTCESTSAASAPDADTEEKSDDSSGDSDTASISPEFKKTMDEYEAWFDHYCEVLKKYQENPSDPDLLAEVTELMSEETEMLDKMENMDQSEMNPAELAYYLEVTARIEKKLLEVAY